MPAIKGVLLDVDGTLINTNDFHAQAWVTVLNDAGYHVTFEQVRPLIGMGSDQLLPRVAQLEGDSDDGKKLSKAWGEVFKAEYLPRAEPFPQAKALLEALHVRGMRLVAASSGEKEIASALLEKVGATGLLSDQTSSSDGDRSKPAPDIVVAALKKIGLPAPEVLLLGDAPYDVQACLPVGIGVVALRCGGFSDSDLKGAIAIYDDPADLLANLDTSPFIV